MQAERGREGGGEGEGKRERGGGRRLIHYAHLASHACADRSGFMPGLFAASQ